MKNKFFRTFAVTLAAVLCLTAFSTTAFAGGADPDPVSLPEETGTPTTGGIELDKTAHIVKLDGEPVELSYKEFELPTYFMENQGVALPREKILNNVWNYDYFGDARTIDTRVKKLRSKLGDKGNYIKTVWGMGYKFEVA